MKKLLIPTIIAMLACVAFSAFAASKGKAKIRFEESSYNFGTIKEAAGPVTHTFTFTNTGDANLTIIDATAQCGCTRPVYSTAPVAPGKKGKVKVTFNPAGRAGSFEKVVTVRTNGSPSKARVKIKGTIIPKNK